MMTSNPIKVILVEDNDLVRRTVAEALMAAGFDVTQACSADDALHIIHSGQPADVIVTDIEMPGSMNGIGLANVAHDRWPEIGLIVTSGRPQQSNGELPVGAAFLPKPSRADEMIGLVQSLSARDRPHLKP